jgi:hypothetical protein
VKCHLADEILNRMDPVITFDAEEERPPAAE